MIFSACAPTHRTLVVPRYSPHAPSGLAALHRWLWLLVRVVSRGNEGTTSLPLQEGKGHANSQLRNHSQRKIVPIAAFVVSLESIIADGDC